MARRCTVCVHDDRLAVDMMLVNHKPFRTIADRFALSKTALIRHHDDHLPEALTKAKAAAETAQADDLLAQVGALRSKAMALLLKAESAGDLRTALAGVRTALACLELLAEMSAQIDRRPVINVLMTPEWATVRAIVIDVLRDDPARRVALADRLDALEAAS